MIRKAVVILALLTATAAFAYLYPAYSQYSENFKYEIKYEKRTFDITEDKISGIEFGCPSSRTCELNFALLTCCSSDSKVEYVREGKDLYITLFRDDNCSLAIISGTIYGIEEGRYNLTFVIEDGSRRGIADKVSFEARV
ncbi:MAG: hypothetical protein J7K36_11130 [Archaeoglobaceae archaeon]|nr:hypothetical protein [Archaeoglobaceae archaeon]